MAKMLNRCPCRSMGRFPKVWGYKEVWMGDIISMVVKLLRLGESTGG